MSFTIRMLLIDLRTFYKNVRPQSFCPISHCKSVAKLSSGNLHGIYVKENSKKAKLPHIQNEKCFFKWQNQKLIHIKRKRTHLSCSFFGTGTDDFENINELVCFQPQTHVLQLMCVEELHSRDLLYMAFTLTYFD